MHKILFVDDERLIREGVQNLIDWIGICGAPLDVAENAGIALEMLEKENYEIVISDIYMQDITGIALAKQVKDKWPNIIVLLLSAYEDFNYAREAIEAGVFKYLLKPIIPEELEEAVIEALIRVETKLEQKIKVEEAQQVMEDYTRQTEKNIWREILLGNCKNAADISVLFSQIDTAKIPKQVFPIVFSSDNKNGLFQFQKEAAIQAERLFEGYIDTLCMGSTLVVLLLQQNSKVTLFVYQDMLKQLSGDDVFMVEGEAVSDLYMLPHSVDSARFRLQRKESHGEKDETEKIINKSLKLIREEISDVDFNINSIATALHLTPAYFSRVFKKKMGITCMEFIKNYRVELAKDLLQGTDISIQEISEMTGYASVNYFSQQFKSITGVSPGHYRKMRES